MERPFTITIFGAESTGKTTLSHQLAESLDAVWTHEFARGYLEKTGDEISDKSMRTIWHGQRKLQAMAGRLVTEYLLQDTDLFSTVGYWKLPHVEPAIGPCPQSLIRDAIYLQSDLYIITLSNIPFEQDPLRYGGNARESLDEYWIDICEKYELPYIILSSSNHSDRVNEALAAIKERRSNLCLAL